MVKMKKSVIFNITLAVIFSFIFTPQVCADEVNIFAGEENQGIVEMISEFDFNDYRNTSGTVAPDKFTATLNDAGKIYGVPAPGKGAGDYCLKIDSAQAAVELVHYPSSALTGELYFEADYMIEGNAIRRLLRLRNNDWSGGNWSDPIALTSNKKLGFMNGANIGGEYSSVIEEGVWFKVKLKLNTTNTQMDVFLNDSETPAATSIKPWQYEQIVKVSRIAIQGNRAVNIGDTAVTYIDNLKIYQIKTPPKVTLSVAVDKNGNTVDSQKVPVDSQGVKLSFDKEMKATTLNKDNIIIKKCNGAYGVEYTPEYDSVSKSVLLKFDEELDIQTDYTVRITTGVESADNTQLAVEMTYDFMTRGKNYEIINQSFTSGASTVTYNASITNMTNESATLKIIIVALSGEGEMLKCVKSDVPIGVGATATPAVDVDISQISGISKLYAFLWDNQENMNAYSYGFTN